MEKNSESSNFEYWDEHSQERKIELVGGRLMVGNGLAGSRYYSITYFVVGGLMLQLLSARSISGSPHSAQPTVYLFRGRSMMMCLASFMRRRRALTNIAQDFTQGEEGVDAGHRGVRNHVLYSLHEVAEALGGQALGRYAEYLQ